MSHAKGCKEWRRFSIDENVPLAEEIISAVAAAVKIPVTVKMRLGWSRDTINAVELAMAAESAGAAAITVHGRTREDFYTGTADWREIKRLWMPSVFLLSETGMWGTDLRQRH